MIDNDKNTGKHNSGYKYLNGLEPDPTGTISYADAHTVCRLAYNDATKKMKDCAIRAFRSSCNNHIDGSKCKVYGNCATCVELDNYMISLDYETGERTDKDREK